MRRIILLFSALIFSATLMASEADLVIPELSP
jgi:hypothetical protein